jgi:hypothetical protein
MGCEEGSLTCIKNGDDIDTYWEGLRILVFSGLGDLKWLSIPV